MEVEIPLQSQGGTPISSPNLRSSLSGNTSSNSVVSSSLDTASASAHLERYDVPWALSDLSIYRGRLPRRTRSYTAFLDWHNAMPLGRHHFRHARPLAGTSRKRLVRQIQQLTKDKADLQAQLAAMIMGSTVSGASASSSARAMEWERKGSPATSRIDGVDGLSRMQGQGEADVAHSTADGFHEDNYSSLDGVTDLAVPLDSSDQTLALDAPSRLEHIAALASRLRIAIQTSTEELLEEGEVALLQRPGMKALLTGPALSSERAQLYARFFAQRL